MSKNAERRGSQEPQVKFKPKYEYTDGEDASELVRAYGYELYPWQKEVINSWLGRDKQDNFTAQTCGLSVPRQNGKNALLEVRELYGLVTKGEKFLHTAHEVKTARKAFLRLAGFFENPREYPELTELVSFIRRTNGQEAIELKNGGLVEFSARSRGAARGFTVDTVVFDEAQELTDEQLNALLPTISASPSGNRQRIYVGTPTPPNSTAEVFGRIRQQGNRKLGNTLSWFEWGIKDIPDRKTSTDALVNLAYKTNPSLGYLIGSSEVIEEAGQMSLDGFSRERLGWWNDVSGAKAVDEKLWKLAYIEPDKAPRGGITTYGIKFSVDGQRVAICGCRHQEDSKYHCELIQYTSLYDGVRWTIDFFNNQERANKTSGIAIDGRSGAGMLINELRKIINSKLIMNPSTKGCIDASVMFDQELRDGMITHTNDKAGGQDALDLSAKVSIKRPVGKDGGWCFGGEEALPLEALTLALWANKITSINPSKKAVIW